MVKLEENSEAAFSKRTFFPHCDDLLRALRSLDSLLERAVALAQDAYGPEAVADPYRGFHITQDEVARLLCHEPGAPIFQGGGVVSAQSLLDSLKDSSRLAWLQRTFSLDSFDVDLILIALAPELDRRYERLYAYLQDNVSHRRPSVDLALNLLCPNAAVKLERRAHFAPDAPLIRHGILRLILDSNEVDTTLLAHTLKLDEQIICFLLHQDSLDSRLDPFCKLVASAASLREVPLSTEFKRVLPALVSYAWEEHRPLRLYFHGPSGARKRDAATALAAEIGKTLLIVDLAGAITARADFPQTLRLIFRYAWFYKVIPCLCNLDVLRSDENSTMYRYLLDMLANDGGITILTGTQPWIPVGSDPIGMIVVPFTMPDFDQRRACWRANLAAAGIILNNADLEALAGRFRLMPGQIAEATATAYNLALWHIAKQSADEQPSMLTASPTVSDLFAASRAQSGHDLAVLARKVESIYTWDDIVLPDDALTQLREICQRVTYHHHVFDDWGFDRKLSQGKGINALFVGPSGTGKTMAAGIIANGLELDLYKIDLSRVVSKYIGETEKNLDRIFQAAENANAILFFDEADALFGKRSEVKDSHDRYANIEISYLLQKMEGYEGLSILATNMHRNMDEAFVRRTTFTVHFPFPDESNRRCIWESMWPAEALLSEDIDLDFLAHQFKLAGGNIQNIALAAAFLAAKDNTKITIDHLLRATRREYQKMGKVLTEAELNGT